MRWLKATWQLYLAWRATPGKKPPAPEAAVNKIDASDGDIAAHVTSNPGGGAGGGVC